ncbi:hypothetical protein CSC94_12655 [Zhengella mangrovi]|uniref:Uncharacterized protein n=1 Tax=Zhengella mangrovi TaxID=1982044 RepID=A0A2G1QLY7_9HYPH|nr:hypothetical protein [Zhengella mangrovi]PHP66536.1 hypothetical protein CSC94_12655 [Zhengella mangrovi]
MNQLTTPRDTTTPATEAQISQALALLSTSLPYRDEGDGELRTRAYLSALHGVTRYGLSLATQAALKGEHGSKFFPSTAEMRGLYDTAMRPVHEQQKAERRAAADAHERETYQWAINAPRASTDQITQRFRDDNRRSERVLEDTPLGRSIAKARTALLGRQIIAEGVSMEGFKRGAKEHQWGEGASYSPLLKTVYR